MTAKINEFSDQMLARYFTSYFSAWDVFRAAVNAYERRKLDSDVSMQERNDIEVELLWLYGEHAKMVQRRTAFLRGALAVNRPSVEQFETIQALSDDVDALAGTTDSLAALSEISGKVAAVMAAVHNEAAPRAVAVAV